MKLSAIKKADGRIWLVHGDVSLAMEAGDELIQLPEGWEQPNTKYRECWVEKDGDIVIDLAKAKAQKLEEIRSARNEKLKDSDSEYMVAHSQDKDLAAIKAKKEALRELPDQVEKDLKKLKKIETVDAYEPEWP